MPNAPLYPNAKPFDCNVLILCEGDVVGYEPQLLKAWADGTDLSGRFVKVLACGTSEALYGIADAVGRTVPIIVVEDRDFRTVDEARKECEKKLKNREGRGLAMRAWIPWGRTEIENYFVDDAILPSVFASAFGCDEDIVRDSVRSVLSTLAVAQALEYARYRARRSWLSTDTNRALRIAAVGWKAAALTSLSASEVRTKLESRLKKWWATLHDGTTWKDPMAGEQLLKDFDTKCNEWSGMTYESDAWRRDWACKELLKHVRMTLAASNAGWWNHPSAPTASVNWGALGSDKAQDDHDRKIERELQSALVRAVVDRAFSEVKFDLRSELDQLATIIRRA